MSDVNKNRLADVDLDADLSVLGDRNTKPEVGRIGAAPKPDAGGGLAEAAAEGRGDSAVAEAAEGAGDTPDRDNRRAEKDAIRNVVEGYGKG